MIFDPRDHGATFICRHCETAHTFAEMLLSHLTGRADKARNGEGKAKKRCTTTT